MKVYKAWRPDRNFVLFPGDCAELLRALPDESIDLVLSSPPYCMGKAYEDKTKAEEFLTDHETILPEIIRVTKPGGSICWQVGYHASAGVLTPLDFIVYRILTQVSDEILLRNRIIWTFGHGLHNSERFSGRHETLLWFTKGKNYFFDLDAVRIPQKYPGKKHFKGTRKGQFSGNPKGKNPSDVWDIPNVKANHVEKTDHPCQFPIALAERIIKSMTKPGGLILDPYAGSGTTGAACALLGRKFVGAEIEAKYHDIAVERIESALKAELRFRPSDLPVYEPPANTPLTTVPAEWQQTRKSP